MAREKRLEHATRIRKKSLAQTKSPASIVGVSSKSRAMKKAGVACHSAVSPTVAPHLRHAKLRTQQTINRTTHPLASECATGVGCVRPSYRPTPFTASELARNKSNFSNAGHFIERISVRVPLGISGSAGVCPHGCVVPFIRVRRPRSNQDAASVRRAIKPALLAPLVQPLALASKDEQSQVTRMPQICVRLSPIATIVSPSLCFCLVFFVECQDAGEFVGVGVNVV